MAAGVFKISYLTRKVAGIDVLQSGLFANVRSPQEVFSKGVSRAGHFIVFVKCGYVPRYVVRDAGNKFGQAFELVVGIIEPKN